MLDFVRVAAAVPDVSVGNVTANTERIIKKAQAAFDKNVRLAVFPELALTGYTCADLFFQKTLLDAALCGLREIISFSRGRDGIIAVGLPLAADGKLFNCAAVISNGKLRGIVPKTYIPNYNEFYERRWFSSGVETSLSELSAAELGISEYQDEDVPFGCGIVFDAGDFSFGAEICEDLWATVSPGSLLALAGAEVIINLSASNETISKRSYRRSLVSTCSSFRQDFCSRASGSGISG